MPPQDDPKDLTFQHSSGSVECKVCLSIHPSYAAYYAHAQGKRHQQILKSLESKNQGATPPIPVTKTFKSVGIPQYDIVKIRDPDTLQLGVRLQLTLDKIKTGVEPEFRLMSAYEQTIDEVNTNYQYLVVAAEPYDSVALRIPASPIDEARTFAHFRKDKTYYVQLLFQEL